MINAKPSPLAVVGSLSFAALSFGFSAPAEAVATVNVNGTDYNITTAFISPDANPTSFSTTSMPWWGDQSLANAFATALGGPDAGSNPPTYSGLPSSSPALPGTFNSAGPFFAYSLGTLNPIGSIVNTYAYFDYLANPRVDDAVNPTSNSTTYAILATPVPLESDTLPIIGSTLFMAGGLWWKRKRAQAKASEFITKQ